MDRVRVLCRVRPTTAEEQTRGERVVAIQGNQRLRLQNAAEYVGEHEASWAFDAAYDTDASQAQVYESIQPITQDVLRGFHATVFAYGQTGAGKTHSMFGPPDCSLDGPDAGVVPRLLKDLFAGLTAGDEVRVSCLELYDDLRDLLNEEHRPLKLRENRKDGSVVVDGAVDAVVKDVPATLALLERALVRRVVASHEMNADSSRSHFVASFRVTRPSINASAIMRLVDLAGSERVAKTKATGGTLNEAKRINSSLSALGNVIKSLVDVANGRDRHVAFRDSKLTWLLKDALGGNAKCAVIACVSPALVNADETASTLKFANRAKLVKVRAQVNERAFHNHMNFGNTPYKSKANSNNNNTTISPKKAKEVKQWYYPSLGSVEVSRIHMHVSTSGVTGASIEFAPVRLSNIRRSSRIMFEELWAHYAADALLAVPGLFGSLDIFGNPAGVIRELRDAIKALGEGKGATAVKGASGAFLIPMERISRSIKNVAEGISFGPASGFVVAPIRKLAEAFEGFATGGREVLGVNQASPSVMRELKCPNQVNTSRRGFNDDELRGMPMLTV